MTQLYCLDSVVFINAWTKRYPFELYPCVRRHLVNLCQSRKLFVPQEVAEKKRKEKGSGLFVLASHVIRRRKAAM